MYGIPDANNTPGGGVSGVYASMSKVFAAWWNVLAQAERGFFVISGCDMVAGSVSGFKINAGTAVQSFADVAVAAQDNLALPTNADATNGLISLVELNPAGAVVLNPGVATANPEPPNPNQANDVIAAFFVPPNNPAVLDLTGYGTVNGPYGANNGAIKVLDLRVLSREPYPALTSAAGGILGGSDITVPNSFTAIINTASLAPGTWLIDTTHTFQAGATAPGTIQLLASIISGSATLSGPISANVSAIAANAFFYLTLHFRVVVTTATVVGVSAASGNANSITAKALRSGGAAGATGWRAARVA